MNLMNFLTFEKEFKHSIRKLKFFRELEDSFYFSILYATCYHFIERKEDFNFCQDEEKLCELLG